MREFSRDANNEKRIGLQPTVGRIVPEILCPEKILGPKKGAGTKENMREPGFTNLVPEGRLNLAQDAVLGDLQARPVPQGRLEIGRDEILENLQPSLRA